MTQSKQDTRHPTGERSDRPKHQQSQQNPQTQLARRSGLSSWWGENPFNAMRRMTEEMDRLFGDFAVGSPFRRFDTGPAFSQQLWSPRVEVEQDGSELTVRAELPGLKKEDVQIEVSEGRLTIQGERRNEREERQEGTYHTERSYGHFYRSLPLPEGAIEESAKAHFRDGVLEVTIQCPPREVSKARKIEIGE
jgi:HSP20 family protein